MTVVPEPVALTDVAPWLLAARIQTAETGHVALRVRAQPAMAAKVRPIVMPVNVVLMVAALPVIAVVTLIVLLANAATQ